MPHTSVYFGTAVLLKSDSAESQMLKVAKLSSGWRRGNSMFGGPRGREENEKSVSKAENHLVLQP